MRSLVIEQGVGAVFKLREEGTTGEMKKISKCDFLISSEVFVLGENLLVPIKLIC